MPKLTRPRERQRLYLQTGNVLPEDYRLRDTFSLARSGWARLAGLYLLAALLFFLFGWLLLDNALRLRPEIGEAIANLSRESPLILTGGNLAGAAFMIVGHELAHGLLIYYYTRSRPVFGLGLFYAYAAAPGWYLPRGSYIAVALAPFALLTAAGAVAVFFIPASLAPAFLFGLTANAAASIGDFAVVAWLLRQPSRILIEPVGESIKLYYT